jgi:hypothetical protein
MNETRVKNQQTQTSEPDPIDLAAQIAVAEGLAPEDSDGLGTKHFLNGR